MQKKSLCPCWVVETCYRFSYGERIYRLNFSSEKIALEEADKSGDSDLVYIKVFPSSCDFRDILR